MRIAFYIWVGKEQERRRREGRKGEGRRDATLGL
jgi:hypothetical protein